MSGVRWLVFVHVDTFGSLPVEAKHEILELDWVVVAEPGGVHNQMMRLGVNLQLTCDYDDCAADVEEIIERHVT